MIKTKKADLLAELEKDTTYVNSFPKSSCTIVDGMALVQKVKCVGLTFDKAADEIFNAPLSSANGSTRIDVVFDINKDESIKNVERNRRCSDTLSFKKIVGTNVIRQWNSFLGDNNNKNSLVHFLVDNWREYTMPVNKVIYATIGDKCICLSDSMNTPTLLCKQEETDTRIFLHCKHASARFREVIIHTPDTDVFVLALGFARLLNCELFIKTGVKDKNINISISRIIRPLHLMLKNPEFMMTFAELGNNWEIDEFSLLSKIEVFVCAMYGCTLCNSVNKLRYASILQF